MRFRVVWADDIEDLPADGDELIGDDAAVALPGERFGTHEGRAGSLGESLQFGESRLELIGEHVVGVRGEGCDTPSGVLARFGFACATPAERREVGVRDADLAK